MGNFEDMLKQIRKLKKGMGVQNLLDAAAKILGNPIAMNNTEYKLIAHTEANTDDPVWQELITLGTFGEITQRFFVLAGFVEEVANKRIAYLKTEHLEYDRINGKLYNKNNTHVSNLVIVACNKPFEQGDVEIFDIVCRLMSNEISNDESVAQYEQEHLEWLIDRLIAGTSQVKTDLAQVEILYAALNSNLYIAVVGTAGQSSPPEFFRDLFKEAQPEHKYAIYKDNVLVLASTNEDKLNVGKAFFRLIKLFEQYDICAGLSGSFENLFELSKHYRQALKMLEVVEKCPCAQKIFPYDSDSFRRLELIERVEGGKDIQYYLNLAPQIFVNPLLFHDLELNLLEYSKNIEIIDPIWQEIITYGTGSDEIVRLFKEDGFIDTMESTKGGALLVSDRIKYDRISWKIYNSDSIMIGCLSIVNTHEPFSEDELVLVGIFSRFLTNEVVKMDYYSKYGQIYSDTIINKLLRGAHNDCAFYTRSINNLYDNLQDNLYIVVIDISRSLVGLSFIRELFNWTDAPNRYAIHQDRIIAIISTKEPLENNSRMDKIKNEFEKNNLYAGISCRFDNIYEIQKYYNQARNVLKSHTAHPSCRIFVCDKDE